MKHEVVDDDAVADNSDDSEIIAKKLKNKEKNSNDNSTANLVDDSNKTNDEMMVQNVKIEGKRKKRKRHSWYAVYFGFYRIFFKLFFFSESDEQQNGDSSLNDSKNGGKFKFFLFYYKYCFVAKTPHYTKKIILNWNDVIDVCQATV